MPTNEPITDNERAKTLIYGFKSTLEIEYKLI